MKYRCPHCKTSFESFEKPHCPTCGKGLRNPDKWKPKPESPAIKRIARQKRIPTTFADKPPLWMLFMNRPRFLVWVLGGCILVVGFLMTYKIKAQVPYVPPTRVVQTQKELMVIRTALAWFRVHCKRYPTTEEGLKGLVRNPGAAGWQGYYLNALMPDLWNHPFQYANTNDTVILFSMGPDGQAGTKDDVQSPPPDYKALMKRLALDQPKK